MQMTCRIFTGRVRMAGIVLIALWTGMILNPAGAVSAQAPAVQLPEADQSDPVEESRDRSFLGDILGQLDPGSLDLGAFLPDDGSASAAGDILTWLGIGNRSLKDCKINPVKDQKYTGKAVTPSLTITYNGSRLKKNVDYTVRYTGNTKVGTATCTVTGKGIYTGTRKVTFRVTKGNTGSAASSAGKKTGKLTVKAGVSSCVYNGKARTPSVKVTYRGKSLTSKFFTVTYKNNKNVGKATITVKGKGEYKDLSGETTFKITLKKTTLKSASGKDTGSVTLGWTADTQADGYQIQACADQAFGSGVKKAAVNGGKTESFVFEKLNSGKKMCFRIRSFKKVGSSNWYSEWSAAKQAVVK